jgi:hypothetical protein
MKKIKKNPPLKQAAFFTENLPSRKACLTPLE